MYRSIITVTNRAIAAPKSDMTLRACEMQYCMSQIITLAVEVSCILCQDKLCGQVYTVFPDSKSTIIDNFLSIIEAKLYYFITINFVV